MAHIDDHSLRIALINSRYPPHAGAGPGYSVQALARGLDQLGHEVHVIHRAPITSATMANDQGVHIYQVPDSDHLRDPSLLIDQYLTQLNPDVVNTHLLMDFNAPGLWQRVKAMGVPLIHTLRAWFLVCNMGGRFKDGTFCASPCPECTQHTHTLSQYTPSLDGIVAISQDLLDGHRQFGGIPDNVATRVIYNSHDVPATLPSAPPRTGIRFGFLGRLFPLKGVELLIDIFSRPKFRNVELWIAGDGPAPYEAKLKQKATPNITFSGYVERDAWLPHIDALITPSLCPEALGRVVIEAKAHGKPSITSDRGGLKELIAPGITGWTFDPDKPDQLTRILREVLANPAQLSAMAPAVRESFAPFGIRTIAEQYAAFYRQIIAARAQGTTAH